MKLKDFIEKYGEYEVSSCFQFGSSEGIQIRLEPPKPKTVWDLEYLDKYYYLHADGTVMCCNCYDNADYLSRLEIGNVFLTQEDAEHEIERRKVETIMIKHGGRRWFKSDIANWNIRYNYLSNHFEYGYTKCTQHQSCIYFDNKEQAVKAVTEIGENRIKQALFEVR